MTNRNTEEEEHGNLLAVVVSKARDLPNRRKFDKQTPYCVVRIQDQVQTTHAIPRAGQNPEWDSELWFSLSGISDYKMSFNIYHETKKEVGLVCKATIDFSQALTKPSKVGFDKWYDLEYDGKPAGQIFLEMSYYPPVDNVPVSNNSVSNKKFQIYKHSQSSNHSRALHNGSVSSISTNKIDFNAINSINLPPLPSMENQTSNFYKNSTGISESYKNAVKDSNYSHSKFDSFKNDNNNKNDEISSSILPPLSELDGDDPTTSNNNNNMSNRNTWYTKINDYAKGFFPKNMTNYTDIFGVATPQPELSPQNIPNPNPITTQKKHTSLSHFDDLEDSFHNVSSNDVFTGFSDDDEEDDDAYYQHKQKNLNSKKNPINFNNNNNAYISPVQSNEGSRTSLNSHTRKHSDHSMNDSTDILQDDELRKSFQKRPLPSMPENFLNSNNNALPSLPKLVNSNITSSSEFDSNININTGLNSNYLQKTAPTPQDTDSLRDRSNSPRRTRKNKNELQHNGSLSYAQIRKLNERKKSMI